MAPGISGTFDLISNIIDPKKHTAALMGWLDNADGRLRVGQFITATVDLPTANDEVAIPESAVLDEGPGSIVFVSPDARLPTGHPANRGRYPPRARLRLRPHPSHRGRTARRLPVALARRICRHCRHCRVGDGLDRAVAATAVPEESVH